MDKKTWKPEEFRTYPYRRKSDDTWDVLVVIFIIVCIAGLIGWLATREPKPKPQPKPIEIKVPDAEKVGHQAGSSAAGFGKGFVDGFKERLNGKEEPKDKK